MVAIDGPSGSGKSTVARRGRRAARLPLPGHRRDVPRRRCAGRRGGRLARRRGGGRGGGPEGATCASTATGGCTPASATSARRSGRSKPASSPRACRRCPACARLLVEQQRALARERGVVMEGRDIGTNVFPDAAVKVYLTASPRCAPERRLRELRAAGGDVTYEEVLANVVERDRRDAERAVAPLRRARRRGRRRHDGDEPGRGRRRRRGHRPAPARAVSARPRGRTVRADGRRRGRRP